MVAEPIPRGSAARNAVRQQIGQDIYSAVERGPMTFIADGGHTAVLLAELAIKRLEEAGWQAPGSAPREYGVALRAFGKTAWRYPRLGEYNEQREDAVKRWKTIELAGSFDETKIVSRTKAGAWEFEGEQ